ncbi:MAG TPA: serine hydrolase [Candidatus Angelobacter sp.]
MLRIRFFVAVFAFAIVSGVPFSSRALGQWSDVGSPHRPSWVDASAERRLQMLPALPAIKNKIHADANAYFGSQGPGMAVGLVLDDGLFYSEGFGYADAQKTSAPDENTIFRAGSLSKVMTGTGLLTLIDDPSRHMSLDDFAADDRFLPELKSVCPKFNEDCARGSQHLGIKLRHLVSHTSGLADVMEQTNAHVPVWLSDLKKSWLLFSPGDFSAYSGVAVEGVGLIEQRISGLSYVEFMHKNLFEPLNMKSTSMDQSTLPQQSLAQKWMFNAGTEANRCLDSCSSASGRCMAQAHSSVERQECVREKKQCDAGCPASKPRWWFTRFDQIIAGDDQPMILPAGGLATTVDDLSRFIKMWLTAKAPEVNGRPILQPDTIKNAPRSMFSSTAAAPKSCKPGLTDKNGFYYSPCGTAYGFGVNWYVGDKPYLQHNGDEPGLSGSETRIDQSRNIGATGLISTEPYPQSPDLDGGFMDTVVFGLLNDAEAADTGASWSGKALPTGVARVLYLSGKKPDKSDLSAFTPGFTAANFLTEANVVSFLTKWQAQIGACSNFRVRKVQSAGAIEVVLSCQRSNWDALLEVEEKAPYRISWPSTIAANTNIQNCTESCNLAQGRCMGQAHSASERQQCVGENKRCLAECK